MTDHHDFYFSKNLFKKILKIKTVGIKGNQQIKAEGGGINSVMQNS